MKYKLNDLLIQYSEKNTNNLYEPVAVGKYGIRKRSEIYKKELADDYSKNKLIFKNTLTIGLGSKQIDVGILTKDAIYSVSPAYSTFRIKTDIVDPDYLNLYFSSLNDVLTKRYMIASARQGKKVDIKEMLKEEVEIPSFSIQQKVINNIRNIREQKNKEIRLIDLLNELVKARFAEMFGDEDNSFGWPTVKIEDVADVKVGVVIKPAQYYTSKENGIKAFRSLNVGEMYIKDDDWVYFTKEGNDKNKKSILKENDLLIVRSGAPGTACVITKEYVGCNAIDVIIASPNANKINPQYLCAFTNYPHGKSQIEQETGGAAQQHFNVGKYKSIELMLPPIELQNRFEEFYKQIEKSISICQKNIELYQELLDKKMDDYFNPKEDEA